MISNVCDFVRFFFFVRPKNLHVDILYIENYANVHKTVLL